MSEPRSTARIFIAYSDDPKRTLVLRRGPSGQVAVFNWNRTSDKFTLGQWLKGKIYSHRVDVSPDGKHWIYLALGRGGETYTVIAKTPYLKALDFHPWAGTWGGGGFFNSNTEYTLTGTASSEGRRLSNHFKILHSETLHQKGLYRRLSQYGWKAIANANFTIGLKHGWILTKHIGNGQKLGRSNETEWHTLSHEGFGLTLKRPGWEWADVDGRKLVFAENGKLMRATLFENAEQPYRSKLVHDFNDYTFEPNHAPY